MTERSRIYHPHLSQSQQFPHLLTYTWDANGNPATILYPGGVKAVYGYDFADRPATLLAQRAAQPDQPLVTGATYLPAGPLSSLALGNGLTETRSFTNRDFPSGTDPRQRSLIMR